MKQIFLISRKDVYHLWPSILIVVALMAAHTVLDMLSQPVNVPGLSRINSAANLSIMLVPLAMAFLIAQLVFQERLPGDRQFWLTRPYRRTNLLASKILLIVVFISIPLFVSDCYILGVQGFGVISVLPKLLLRQVFLAIVFILPSFGIAAITTGLTQFVLVWFILIIVLIGEPLLLANGTGVELVSGTALGLIVTATLIGVIVWQYTTRRTTLSRAVLITVAIGSLPLMRAMSYLPFFHSTPPSLPEQAQGFDIRVGYDTSLRRPTKWDSPRQGFSRVFIPMIVAGLPPETLLRGMARNTFTIAGKRGVNGRDEWIGFVERDSNGYWQRLDLPKHILNAVAQRTVNLHTSIDLEIVNDKVEETIALSQPSFVAPRLGLCRIFSDPEQSYLTCKTGLDGAIETSVQIGPTTGSVEPHDVPWGLSPTTNSVTLSTGNEEMAKGLILTPRRKLAVFRRSLDLSGVQLTQYVME